MKDFLDLELIDMDEEKIYSIRIRKISFSNKFYLRHFDETILVAVESPRRFPYDVLRCSPDNCRRRLLLLVVAA